MSGQIAENGPPRASVQSNDASAGFAGAIVAVSKLIASGMNRHSMSQSLITLKNYSADDKGMKVHVLSQLPIMRLLKVTKVKYF